MARDSDPLVFSTDRSHLALCPACGSHPCACAPPAEVVPTQTVLRLRLDTKGRGGKAVTVVYDLPPNPAYLAGLIKKLKAHCGTGGALKQDRMEIQGDQRDKVHDLLAGMGFTVKRCGG
ncbi:MAG: translation initiation factor [bacterium]